MRKTTLSLALSVLMCLALAALDADAKSQGKPCYKAGSKPAWSGGPRKATYRPPGLVGKQLPASNPWSNVKSPTLYPQAVPTGALAPPSMPAIGGSTMLAPYAGAPRHP